MLVPLPRGEMLHVTADHRQGLVAFGRETGRAGAGWFSRATMTFCRPLINLGYRRPLTHADLWPLAPGESVAAHAAAFRRIRAARAARDAAQLEAFDRWALASALASSKDWRPCLTPECTNGVFFEEGRGAPARLRSNPPPGQPHTTPGI